MWIQTPVESLSKAVNIGPKVRRDRLSDERRVEPLKIACDGELEAVLQARLSESIELAFVHDPATSIQAHRFSVAIN
jgi:hypothetical protein